MLLLWSRVSAEVPLLNSLKLFNEPHWENMMTEPVASKKTTRTPKSLRQLSKLITNLARGEFAKMRISHACRMKVSKLEQERDLQIAEINAKQSGLKAQLFSLAKELRTEITSRGKSVIFASGEIGWREGSPSVQILPGFTEAGVIKKLEQRGRKYLRFTPKINKSAILQAVKEGTFKGIAGIFIKQGEELFVSLAPRGKERPETIVVEPKQ